MEKVNQNKDDSLLLKAMELAEAGNIDFAEKKFLEFTREYSLDANGWYRFSLFLSKNNKYKETIEAISEAIKINQKNIFYRNVLVIALWKDGQLDEAIKQGYLSLVLKDEIVVDNFKKSDYAHIKLNDVHPYFKIEEKKKNIISFSLWGSDPVYVTGALINAQLIPYIYEGWTSRFYCDDSVPKKALQTLKKLGAEVVLIEDENQKKLRSLWRFFVMDDPNVNYFLCRDADSRVNVKEALAVHEWVNSNKKFHVMRDHVMHNGLILAGMWGGVAGVIPNIRNILLQSKKYFNNKFFDQVFLMEVVWPLIRNDVMVHDSVYAFPNGKDFPLGFNLHPYTHVGGGVKKIPEWKSFIFKEYSSDEV